MGSINAAQAPCKNIPYPTLPPARRSFAHAAHRSNILHSHQRDYPTRNLTSLPVLWARCSAKSRQWWRKMKQDQTQAPPCAKHKLLRPPSLCFHPLLTSVSPLLQQGMDANSHPTICDCVWVCSPSRYFSTDDKEGKGTVWLWNYTCRQALWCPPQLTCH